MDEIFHFEKGFTSSKGLKVRDLNDALHEDISAFARAEFGSSSRPKKLIGRVDDVEALTFIPSALEDRKPIIHVSLGQFKEIREKNSTLVVGSFIGKTVPYGLVKDWATRVWKLSDFEMKPSRERLYTFK